MLCIIPQGRENARKSGGSNPPPYDYAAASNIFSIKMPYPVVGSLTRTWVTAPMSLPSCIIGELDTSVSSKGQRIFVFFCGFYAFLRVKSGLWHTSTAVLNLTYMNWRNRSLLNSLSLSTNSELCRTVGSILWLTNKFLRPPEIPEALCLFFLDYFNFSILLFCFI